MKAKVKGVKPYDKITITNGVTTYVTSPVEICAALAEYRKPLLSEDVITRLLESAIEGGSSYWARELNPLGEKYDKRRNHVAQCLERGFYVIDAETDERHEVKPEDITAACGLLRNFRYSNGSPAPHFNDAVSGNDDADTGDVFLQLCVFKELVYG